MCGWTEWSTCAISVVSAGCTLAMMLFSALTSEGLLPLASPKYRHSATLPPATQASVMVRGGERAGWRKGECVCERVVG